MKPIGALWGAPDCCVRLPDRLVAQLADGPTARLTVDILPIDIEGASATSFLHCIFYTCLLSGGWPGMRAEPTRFDSNRFGLLIPACCVYVVLHVLCVVC